MIAIISDSHIGRKAEGIPEKILEVVEEAEMAVHCGDFETRDVHDRIKELSGKFIAVQGNCDRFEIDDYQDFEYQGTKFGVTHGKGIQPRGHKQTLANIADEMEVKVLFHGHTHQQEAVKHQDKILLNPGSCTGAPGGSYQGGDPQMMTVGFEGSELIAELITLENTELKTENERFEV